MRGTGAAGAVGDFLAAADALAEELGGHPGVSTSASAVVSALATMVREHLYSDLYEEGEVAGALAYHLPPGWAAAAVGGLAEAGGGGGAGVPGGG